MKTIPKPRRKANHHGKGNLDRLLFLSTDFLLPSPENLELYRPVDPTDPDIVKMAGSMRDNGVLQHLIVTDDGYIVSGHRRHCAAKVAGLKKVPCLVLSIRREDDPEGFVRLLAQHNIQREKTLDEKLREEVVSINIGEAASALYEYRREKAAVDARPMTIIGEKRRKKISPAKAMFLAAVLAIVDAMRDYWPLSDRRIHYALLNDPPLIHSSKKKSRYRNNATSYRALVDLLTRARLEGSIPFAAIADETRPVSIWGVHQDPRLFVRGEMDGLFRGYWRNLMQSQPNHHEIIGEKNTIASTLKPVAAEYTIPLTTGRGYCSLPPRHAMAERFHASGKEKLVLLIVSDFDPDGEEIAHSFARSMRDDFDIDEVHPIKVALTAEQVKQYKLTPQMKATDKESSNRHKFMSEHGDSVFELEALAPDVLQTILRQAIEGAIDRDAYQHEINSECADAAWLDGVRQRVLAAMRGIDLEAEGDE